MNIRNLFRVIWDTNLVKMSVLIIIMFISLQCKRVNGKLRNEDSIVSSQYNNSEESFNRHDTLLELGEDSDSIVFTDTVQNYNQRYTKEELDSVRRLIDSKYATMPKLLRDNIVSYGVTNNPYGITLIIKNCTPDLLKLFKDSVTDFPDLCVLKLL